MDVRNLLAEPRVICRVDGDRASSNLSVSEFAGLAPHTLRPISSIPAWKGKQSYEGRWWFSSLECHVPYATAREPLRVRVG